MELDRGTGKTSYYQIGDAKDGDVFLHFLNLDCLEFARIFNLHVKMLDILVRFYGKTRKNISLYYIIKNIVLFPNRIKAS